MVPLLHRFGELVAPLTFVCPSYVSIFVISWNVGTGTGLQFFLLVIACLVVLDMLVDRHRFGENQGQWRLLHGCQRGAVAAA
jgi:predicted membrane metal-binding protein